MFVLINFICIELNELDQINLKQQRSLWKSLSSEMNQLLQIFNNLN